MKRKINMPTLEIEERLWQSGLRYVAGIDEAGRGALAGPVVAAAVIVAPGSAYADIWAQVRDSKQLTARQRAALATQIQETALAWAVGVVSAQTIDRVNIAVATRMAMRQAVEALQPAPEYLVLDWVRLPQVNLHQESLVRADQHVVSVAAASILAKVHRDTLLVEMDQRYPDYGFASHKGYGTAAHKAALERCGPCLEHRHSFAPIARKPSLFTQNRQANRSSG